MADVNLLPIVMSVVISYLVGSIMFAVLISKGIYKQDIRTLGSKNAGMSNMMRNFGKKAGIGTFVGDLLKGTVAVVVSSQIGSAFDGNELTVVLCTFLGALGAMFGHMFPLYFGFKGGKGVATGVGCVFGVNPVVAPILLIIFFIAFKSTGYFSVGSIAGTVAFPILHPLYSMLVGVQLLPVELFLSVVLSGIVVFMHRSNLVRLIKHTEPKYGSSKNK